MSKSQGLSTKRLQTGYFVVSTELGIFGAAGYFFGWDGDSFLFYSGPMLSYVSKAKGCRQKDPKLGILLCRQSWVFLGQLGILG